MPGRGEQDSDVLALQLLDGDLGPISLDEHISEHLLHVGVSLLRPRKPGPGLRQAALGSTQ
eukprot:754770-Hanusia_phi.AAC.3